MSGRNTWLAGLLRKAQWMLDDTAFNLPRGEVGDQQKRDLADALDELAAALRESTSDQGAISEQAPAVVEVER